MNAPVARNGALPQATRTPAGGPTRTEARAAIPREELPPGDGEIDAPTESEEIEETLEAFRQLSGEADVAPPPAPPVQDAEPEYDEGQLPEDEGFPFPGEQAAEAPPAGTVEPQPPVQQPVIAEPPSAQPVAPSAAQPTGATPQAQALDPSQALQQMSTQLDQNLQIVQDELAKQVYAVSDKDLEDLAEKPKEVYSRMLARVHVNAVSSTMRTVAQMLPMVVVGMLQAQARNNAAQEQFWQAFPQLNKTDPRHRSLVGNIARNIRATNPNMSTEDAVRYTGAQALVMLNLQGQPGAQPAPARRAPQMPGRQVRTTPAAYSPSAARAAPGTPTAPKRNQWDLMTSLIELGDQGRFDPAS